MGSGVRNQSDRENLKLRHQRGGRNRAYRLITVSAATNFQMSAYAERLASHSRNSLSKTESTPKWDGWQEPNLPRNQIGFACYVSLTTKAASLGGLFVYLMASHWPPEKCSRREAALYPTTTPAMGVGFFRVRANTRQGATIYFLYFPERNYAMQEIEQFLCQSGYAEFTGVIANRP